MKLEIRIASQADARRRLPGLTVLGRDDRERTHTATVVRGDAGSRRQVASFLRNGVREGPIRASGISASAREGGLPGWRLKGMKEKQYSTEEGRIRPHGIGAATGRTGRKPGIRSRGTREDRGRRSTFSPSRCRRGLSECRISSRLPVGARRECRRWRDLALQRRRARLVNDRADTIALRYDRSPNSVVSSSDDEVETGAAASATRAISLVPAEAHAEGIRRNDRAAPGGARDKRRRG